MMKGAINNIFLQIERVLQQIDTEQYSQQLEVLHGASVGQHVRHTLEMFTCLLNGMETGVVSYDKRKRDIQLEIDKQFAIDQMYIIVQKLPDADKKLMIELNYQLEDEQVEVIETTCYRELAYTLEHAVHHMALIKIGLTAIDKSIQLPKDFGVASSTIRYKESLAN